MTVNLTKPTPAQRQQAATLAALHAMTPRVNEIMRTVIQAMQALTPAVQRAAHAMNNPDTWTLCPPTTTDPEGDQP